jgi:hypothetical protein
MWREKKRNCARAILFSFAINLARHGRPHPVRTVSCSAGRRDGQLRRGPGEPIGRRQRENVTLRESIARARAIDSHLSRAPSLTRPPQPAPSMLPLAKVREATAAKLTEEDPLYLQVRSTTRTRAQWGPRPSMREVSLAQGRTAPSRRARRGLVGLRRLAWGDTRPHAACCRRSRSEGRTRHWILTKIPFPLPPSPPPPRSTATSAATRSSGSPSPSSSRRGSPSVRAAAHSSVRGSSPSSLTHLPAPSPTPPSPPQPSTRSSSSSPTASPARWA